MSLQFVSKINELQNNSGCIYNALEDILTSCRVPENANERTWLGVKLSICEYAAAGIEYPPICLSESHLTECTRLLETKPTWWTTYSGNYRHISVICSEFRPQYESNKLFNAITNSSMIVENNNHEISQKLNTFYTNFIKTADTLTNLSTSIQSNLENLEIRLVAMDELTEIESQKSKEFMLTVYSELENCLGQVNLVTNAINEVELGSLQTQERLQLFQESLGSIELRQNYSVEYLEASINSSTTRLSYEVNSFVSILDKLKPLAYLLRGVSFLMYPVLIGLGIYWVIKLNSSEVPQKIELPETTTIDNDLLFL